MARRAQSYGAMMDELQALLTDMQSDELDVDAAIAKYRRGQELLAELEAYLQTAQNEIMQYKGDADRESS